MSRTRKVALLVAVAVGLTLIPVGTAAAAPGATSAAPEATSAYTKKERRAERRQNRKLARTLGTLNDLIDIVTDHRGTLGEREGQANSISARLAFIEAAAPQIVAGLNALRDGLVLAGEGLMSLRTLATSTEYGIGQVFIAGSADPGAFLVTPDIPDAVQQAQTTQSFLAGSAGEITVQVGVRSAESDGTGGVPAAHCRVTVVQDNGAGPPSSRTRTSLPNAALGGAPFYAIDNKSPQTSTTDSSFPFGPIATDLPNLVDLTTAGNSTAPAGSPTATAGFPYSVTLSCVDTTPSATDPSE